MLATGVLVHSVIYACMHTCVYVFIHGLACLIMLACSFLCVQAGLKVEFSK